MFYTYDVFVLFPPLLFITGQRNPKQLSSLSLGK